MNKNKRIKKLADNTESIKRGINRAMLEPELSLERITQNLDSMLSSIEAGKMPEYQEVLRITREATAKYRDAIIKKIDYLYEESVKEINQGQ